ncbi:hypothetical protein P153DRAFT_292037 [Dothidotthia symphoricarpi CBS 119687]|uniref:Mso1 N-terminal domain-containing protein n=1 Tax=Dothidotthia symphoricarpi CBS 119687 TaxID=1392245 RepID=A0A6A6AAM6_9PLEO|nr:uncharacterized protein P153DRAFT_292037 [Dothidotthia symphoricarpi CBS 119687]KAF2128972.1 hypothetical protein P153DRAFT_292037 [Dothidotthia symphoricarpi CBS 119687]
MSSYLNNLLTNTTSKYNSLRQQLLSDEADGNTEDDSHISRVLRAYYTEKGRPFPPWLPADPKAPQAAPAQFASSAGRGQAPPLGRGSTGGGLSDLWDTPQQPPQPQEPLSLRRAGGRGGATRPLQTRMAESYAPEPQSQGRPLPSQRAGSYQSTGSGGGAADPSPPPSAGGGTTAQERLKARLWGSGRSNSSTGGAQSPGPASPSQSGMRTPFERAPPSSGRAPYPDGGGSSYSGGGRPPNQQQSSYSMPDPYAPGGGGGGYGGAPQRAPPGGGRVGLPSGPRMRSN